MPFFNPIDYQVGIDGNTVTCRIGERLQYRGRFYLKVIVQRTSLDHYPVIGTMIKEVVTDQEGTPKLVYKELSRIEDAQIPPYVIAHMLLKISETECAKPDLTEEYFKKLGL